MTDKNDNQTAPEVFKQISIVKLNKYRELMEDAYDNSVQLKEEYIRNTLGEDEHMTKKHKVIINMYNEQIHQLLDAVNELKEETDYWN